MSEQLELFETESEVEHRSRLTFDSRRIGREALAVVALVGVSVGIGAGAKVLSNGQPGDIDSYRPPASTKPLIDDDMVVVSWNMHNETSAKYRELKQLAEEHNPDAIMLQEVNAQDAKGLRKHFSDWYINFVLANPETKFLQGGYGNVVMTKQEPVDVESIALNGNTNLSKVWESAKGLVEDVVLENDTKFRRTSDATQEDRSAIFQTIKVRTKDGLKSVRIGTSHIAGDPRVGPKVHDKQFDKLKDWTIDREQDDEATILCMDSNGSLETTTFEFAESGYVAPPVEGTTVPKTRDDRGLAIDQCVYKPAGILRLSQIKILKEYATDHFAILFTRLKR